MTWPAASQATASLAGALSSAASRRPSHSYLLYGFGSEEKLTLRVVGRRLLETEEITVSPQGAHFAEIEDRYPSGLYVIVVTSGDTVIASTSFEKRGGRPIQLRD